MKDAHGTGVEQKGTREQLRPTAEKAEEGDATSPEGRTNKGSQRHIEVRGSWGPVKRAQESGGTGGGWSGGCEQCPGCARLL